jgi:hypothetical protein
MMPLCSRGIYLPAVGTRRIAMYFHLKCECGHEVSVPEGAAGVSLACPCGRRVVVPELTELRQRAAAGEIGCVLRTDSEKLPEPPGPIRAATYTALCYVALLVGGLIVGMGVLLIINIGCVGFLGIVSGIAVMGFAARSLASRHDISDVRAEERRGFAKLTGDANRSVGRPMDEHAQTSVTDRPRT